jgi:DNA-binding NtrC family response regulator
MTVPAQPSQREPFLAERRGGILIAEDDSDLRFLITGWLEVDGHRVVGVSNARAMLLELRAAMKRGEAFDLVVSDHRMQGMAGLEAFRQARDWGVRVPFVLITAFGSDELEERARALEVDFLRKPFELDDLRTLVDWHIRVKRGDAIRCTRCGDATSLRGFGRQSPIFLCAACRAED